LILLDIEFNHLFEEETLKDLLSKPNVKHHNKARLREVEGNVSGVTGVRVRNIGDSKADDKIIEVEGAFIYGAGGGSKPITEFLSGSGIDLDDAGGVLVDDSMESISQKGVFAIGDIRNTPYKQVVVAAADGCVAAMSIEKFLKDRKNIKVDWIHK
jgi:thioredoxin reductase (NADPH)